MFYKYFDKKYTGTSTHTGTGINFENQQLAEELNKTIIGKLYLKKTLGIFIL